MGNSDVGKYRTEHDAHMLQACGLKSSQVMRLLAGEFAGFLPPKVLFFFHRVGGQAVRLVMTCDDESRRTVARLSGGGNI